MFEVYYRPPSDPVREARIFELVGANGGRLDFREAPEVDGSSYVCLTYEFDELPAAEAAAHQIRTLGEHVEGPVEYG